MKLTAILNHGSKNLSALDRSHKLPSSLECATLQYLLFTYLRLQKQPQISIMSKIETASKVSLKLTSMINFRRRGARAELLTLDTVHKLAHSLEMV